MLWGYFSISAQVLFLVMLRALSMMPGIESGLTGARQAPYIPYYFFGPNKMFNVKMHRKKVRSLVIENTLKM